LPKLKALFPPLASGASGTSRSHQQKQRQSVQQDDQPIAAANFLHIDAHLFVAQRLLKFGASSLRWWCGISCWPAWRIALQLIAVGEDTWLLPDVTLLDVAMNSL